MEELFAEDTVSANVRAEVAKVKCGLSSLASQELLGFSLAASYSFQCTPASVCVTGPVEVGRLQRFSSSPVCDNSGVVFSNCLELRCSLYGVSLDQ